jgi:tetratricopeptide (TPR) repeat protein
LAAAAFPLMAQNGGNQSRYLELLRNGDFKGLEQHLKNWEHAEPENPELYIGYFNYYVRRNLEYKQDLIKEGRRMFMGNRPIYQKDDVYKGIEFLDKGIALAPKRIDMRWGKIEMLMEISDYNAASDAIITVLTISKKTKGRWFKGNTSVKDGEKYVLEYLMRFYRTLADIISFDAYSALQKCSDVLIALYPKNIDGYNFAALACMFSQRAEDALPYLLKAETLDKNDCIILLNIGRTYKMLSQKENAAKYFKRVISKGNSEERRVAEKMLNGL